MRMMLYLFLLLMATSVYAQNTKQLDKKYGFRDAIFGMNLSEFDTTMLCSFQPYSEKICDKIDENLTIGSYGVNAINYFFYKNLLYEVMIETKGILNSRGVLGVFQQAYGPGVKNNMYIENYIWKGRKVIMVYDENPITYDATILIQSRPLLKIKRRDTFERQRQAATSL